jgi:hypothetical protein
LLALTLPGLGYVAHRQVGRGVCVFVGVMGLFLSGLLVGGINVVDRQEDGLWFIAQAMTGPVAFAADHFHQTTYKVADVGPPRSPTPEEWLDWQGPGPRPARPSIGKVNDAGSLFVAMAGMMNLIAILDCLFGGPAPVRRGRTTATGAAGGGS